MLNRLIGRQKARDLTAAEINQVSGAGCTTLTTSTYNRTCYYSSQGELQRCDEWVELDEIIVCGA